MRQSETPDASGRTILEAEERVEFLSREVRYNRQVLDVLTAIQHVSGLLDRVEQARQERRIVDSLHLLEREDPPIPSRPSAALRKRRADKCTESWAAIDNIPVGKSVRAMRLLDMRAFELKSDVHDVFDHVWRALVNVDVERGRVTIYDSRDDEAMNLQDAVVGLKAYKEVDKRMAQFWHDLDKAIVAPRTDIERSPLASVQVSGVGLSPTRKLEDKS